MRARLERLTTLAFIALIMSAPLLCGAFWLNRIAECLVFGMLGVAMALSWGYAGILNLGQGLFFGLGAYMTAMSLKLAAEASRPQGADTPVPDFMRWLAAPGVPAQLCCITHGAFLWIPFETPWFGLGMSLAMPALAAAIAWTMLRRRFREVFLALLMPAAMLLVRQAVVAARALTDGVYGLSDLGDLSIGGLAFERYGVATYYLVAVALAGVLIGARTLVALRGGRSLQAVGDTADRAGRPGRDAATYRGCCFVVSAAICGLAGALYVTVAHDAAPGFFDLGFSLTMIAWAAIGGRASLLGAGAAAILIGLVDAQVSESESLVRAWRVLLGLIGVLALLALPRGLAGLAGDATEWLVVRIARWHRPAGAVPGAAADPRPGL